jgi:starch synthase
MLELILLMPSRVDVWTESNVFAAIWYNYCEKTGGLKDTVIDFGDNGNGISHDQSSVGDMLFYSKGNKLV